MSLKKNWIINFCSPVSKVLFLLVFPVIFLSNLKSESEPALFTVPSYGSFSDFDFSASKEGEIEVAPKAEAPTTVSAPATTTVASDKPSSTSVQDATEKTAPTVPKQEADPVQGSPQTSPEKTVPTPSVLKLLPEDKSKKDREASLDELREMLNSLEGGAESTETEDSFFTEGLGDLGGEEGPAASAQSGGGETEGDGGLNPLLEVGLIAGGSALGGLALRAGAKELWRQRGSALDDLKNVELYQVELIENMLLQKIYDGSSPNYTDKFQEALGYLKQFRLLMINKDRNISPATFRVNLEYYLSKAAGVLSKSSRLAKSSWWGWNDYRNARKNLRGRNEKDLLEVFDSIRALAPNGSLVGSGLSRADYLIAAKEEGVYSDGVAGQAWSFLRKGGKDLLLRGKQERDAEIIAKNLPLLLRAYDKTENIINVGPWKQEIEAEFGVANLTEMAAKYKSIFQREDENGRTFDTPIEKRIKERTEPDRLQELVKDLFDINIFSEGVLDKDKLRQADEAILREVKDMYSPAGLPVRLKNLLNGNNNSISSNAVRPAFLQEILRMRPLALLARDPRLLFALYDNSTDDLYKIFEDAGEFLGLFPNESVRQARLEELKINELVKETPERLQALVKVLFEVLDVMGEKLLNNNFQESSSLKSILAEIGVFGRQFYQDLSVFMKDFDFTNDRDPRKLQGLSNRLENLKNSFIMIEEKINKYNTRLIDEMNSLTDEIKRKDGEIADIRKNLGQGAGDPSPAKIALDTAVQELNNLKKRKEGLEILMSSASSFEDKIKEVVGRSLFATEGEKVFSEEGSGKPKDVKGVFDLLMQEAGTLAKYQGGLPSNFDILNQKVADQSLLQPSKKPQGVPNQGFSKFLHDSPQPVSSANQVLRGGMQNKPVQGNAGRRPSGVKMSGKKTS